MAALKRIFISRDLGANSPFRALLGERALIEGQSLVAFEALPIQVLPTCDWLFFYSKKGIQFGWEALSDLVAAPKVAVLGQASAEYLSADFGCAADFIGTGAPESTAAAFLALAKGQRVCFVQAKQSRQSVAKLLGQQIQAQSLAVYNNQPKASLELPVCDILVFTSPLNAQAYYQHYQPLPHQKVVAIGQTTAKALRQLGITPHKISAVPHERELANCCLLFLS
jgi:uroporphyrinogen-III synthase